MENNIKVFAISDLHLPGNSDKPMNVFGKNWDNYIEKIEEDWKKKVTDDDIVLLAGDLSWAMRIDDAIDDIKRVGDLPGTKIILKGNHDFWWQGIGKVRAILPDKFYAVQNDCVKVGNAIICGSRGWTCPNPNDFSLDDKKIYLRESERLEMSLKSIDKIKEEGDTVIAMMHYPPFNVKREESNFTQCFEKYGITKVIYGHLHGSDSLSMKTYVKNGVTYYLTSCDLVNFELQEIM